MQIETIGKATLYLADCREVLERITADVVITDPPYPDYYVEEYKYEQGIIDFLAGINCKQLVFWSGSAEFPLDWSAVHIWNKNPSNHGAQYERIFERNGGKHQKVYTYYMVNSTVAAQMTGDELNGHPSQKPIRLIKKLVSEVKAASIFDPFMGSGTTGVAAVEAGKNFIGCEINPEFFAIACKRIRQAQQQGQLAL